MKSLDAKIIALAALGLARSATESTENTFERSSGASELSGAPLFMRSPISDFKSIALGSMAPIWSKPRRGFYCATTPSGAVSRLNAAANSARV